LEFLHCPNKPNCQVFSIEGFVEPPEMKEFYAAVFCTAGEEAWKQCMRYKTRMELNLCPDFVMPDSLLTTEEIMDRLESE
jgi:hypothetical protein